jgi:hypothetical protein
MEFIKQFERLPRSLKPLRPCIKNKNDDSEFWTVRNQLWSWQSLTPASGGGEFFEFCNALEVKDGVAAGPSGWGLQHALDAWGAYETIYVASGTSLNLFISIESLSISFILPF